MPGHPGIDVRISTTHRLIDFAHDGVDVAVRHGLGHYPGLTSGTADRRSPVSGVQPAHTAGAQAPENGRCVKRL